MKLCVKFLMATLSLCAIDQTFAAQKQSPPLSYKALKPSLEADQHKKLTKVHLFLETQNKGLNQLIMGILSGTQTIAHIKDPAKRNFIISILHRLKIEDPTLSETIDNCCPDSDIENVYKEEIEDLPKPQPSITSATIRTDESSHKPAVTEKNTATDKQETKKPQPPDSACPGLPALQATQPSHETTAGTATGKQPQTAVPVTSPARYWFNPLGWVGY